MDTDSKRRQLILGLAGLMAAGPALATRLLPTPEQMAGPFYPLRPPLDKDNDLTRVEGLAGVAEGRVTDLAGRVLDPDGRPGRHAPGLMSVLSLASADSNRVRHMPRTRLAG